LLLVFNLVPALPLDGGRVFRSALWQIKGDHAWATRIAALIGIGIGALMIAAGSVTVFVAGAPDGVWLAFIGWFLWTAARESYAQVELRNVLAGLKAQDVMTRELPAVTRDISLEEYVHDVLRTGARCHLVLGGNELVGLVTLHRTKLVPREEWANTSIQAVMIPREKITWARPDEPVLSVLERMQGQDINQMPVVDEARVVGVISRETILRVLQTRLQLAHLAEQ